MHILPGCPDGGRDDNSFIIHQEEGHEQQIPIKKTRVYRSLAGIRIRRSTAFLLTILLVIAGLSCLTGCTVLPADGNTAFPVTASPTQGAPDKHAPVPTVASPTPESPEDASPTSVPQAIVSAAPQATVPSGPADTLPVPEDFALSDLDTPDVFTRSALEHIFSGSVNARGAATGYHYEGVPWARGSVIPGSASDTDENGVYEARVTVDGVKKSGNGGFSTFYPSSLSPQEVANAIAAAYETRILVSGNTWRGEGYGIPILMYLDGEERIISAFPEYEGG